MKMPRDLSARDMARTLAKLGYEVTRQKGSHIRLTTNHNGEHHVSVPNHNPLKIGTASGILADVAEHFGLSRMELMSQLFGEG